jgi:hypothetical protein
VIDRNDQNRSGSSADGRKVPETSVFTEILGHDWMKVKLKLQPNENQEPDSLASTKCDESQSLSIRVADGMRTENPGYGVHVRMRGPEACDK